MSKDASVDISRLAKSWSGCISRETVVFVAVAFISLSLGKQVLRFCKKLSARRADIS